MGYMTIKYYIETKPKYDEPSYNEGFVSIEFEKNKERAIKIADEYRKQTGRAARIRTWEGKTIYQTN
jgi:hypothetical protein